MGFEYAIVIEPENLHNIKGALNDYKRYLKANKIKKDGGLLGYHICKSENEVLHNVPRENLPPEELARAKAKKHITDSDEWVPMTIEDCYPEYVQHLRKGKWLIHWYDIEWLVNFPKPILFALYQACKKHNCKWLIDEMAQTSGRWFAEATEGILKAMEPLGDVELRGHGWSVRLAKKDKKHQ